jgi:hypothetical protein
MPLNISSSSTLWATGKVQDIFCFGSPAERTITPASKEWIIPAKPKPGRKPKNDIAAPTAEEADPGDVRPLSLVILVHLLNVVNFHRIAT